MDFVILVSYANLMEDNVLALKDTIDSLMKMENVNYVMFHSANSASETNAIVVLTLLLKILMKIVFVL